MPLSAGPGWGRDPNKTTVCRDARGINHWSVPSCGPDRRWACPPGAFKPTPVRYVPTISDRLGAAGLSRKIYGTPYPVNWVPEQKSACDWPICPSLAECLYTSQDQNLARSDQFVKDGGGGLPAYSAVVPGAGTSGNSCHNGYSITVGDDWPRDAHHIDTREAAQDT